MKLPRYTGHGWNSLGPALLTETIIEECHLTRFNNHLKLDLKRTRRCFCRQEWMIGFDICVIPRNSPSSLVGRHRSCGNITVLSSMAFYPMKVGLFGFYSFYSYINWLLQFLFLYHLVTTVPIHISFGYYNSYSYIIWLLQYSSYIIWVLQRLFPYNLVTTAHIPISVKLLTFQFPRPMRDQSCSEVRPTNFGKIGFSDLTVSTSLAK